jgi:c-di-GMP-binding flagellar brake protein YcgR
MFDVITLRAEQSNRMLRCAARNGQAVSVRPKAWNRALVGELQVAEHGDVDIVVELSADEFDPIVVNMYCEVIIELEDGRYQFDSHIIAARPRSQSTQLLLAWPDQTLVFQRRRAGRVRVAHSSVVQVHRDEGEGMESFNGQLYNLSPHGLAFKVTADVCSRLQIGEQWSICFELPDEDHTFRVDADVRRILRSSASGYLIVGAEFHTDGSNANEVERIGSYLTASQEEVVTIGEQ